MDNYSAFAKISMSCLVRKRSSCWKVKLLFLPSLYWRRPVYCTGSLDAALELAKAGLMHVTGPRTFTLRTWMINEGDRLFGVGFSQQQGVSFGNLLIKQVVEELSAAHPQLDTFLTLSPIPGLNRWRGAETETPDIQRLAAHYLLNERSENGSPLDPVARFHLGNGAQIHAVHANADVSAKGQKQSNGAMANYLYDSRKIEKNHAVFLSGATLPASKAVIALANEAKPLLKTKP